MKDAIVSGYVVEWDDNKNEINQKKHGISFLSRHMYLQMKTELNSMTVRIAFMKTGLQL